MKILPVIAALLAGSSASAQPVTLKPLVDARLHYEHVEQAGAASQAEALTVRIRPGVQASTGRWSALVEAEGTLALVEDYNNGTNGRIGFPNVIDPQNIEFNRAQIR